MLLGWEGREGDALLVLSIACALRHRLLGVNGPVGQLSERESDRLAEGL